MLVFDQLKKNDPQLQLLALTLCSGLFVLFVGLWWVQVVNATTYQESMETQSFRTVRIPAVRGKILDRNGSVLAENRPSYNINLYLEDLTKQFKKEFRETRRKEVVTTKLPFWKHWLGFSSVRTQYVKLSPEEFQKFTRDSRYRVANSVVKKVSDMLGTSLQLDYTNFYRHYETRRALPYTIASNLPISHIARFEERASDLLGVDLEVGSSRYYPCGDTASHVLGYVIRRNDSVTNEQAFYDYRLPDITGVIGIEGRFDLQLRGAAGEKTVVVNNLGYRQAENIVTPIEPGSNVVLTFDLKIQQAAEAVIRKQLGAAKHAAIIVMEVQSGDVLAIASSPVSDPNCFIRGFTRPELERWHDNDLGVQKNRATREAYQAGSIFKTMVALAALENGLNPLETFRVEPNPQNTARGAYYVGNQRIKDTAPPGIYDLRRALIRSSNSYFVHCGLQPGVFPRVVELGRRLHLGERIGLPLLQESAGHFPTAQRVRKSDWRDGNTAHICIGQGEMDVTPMQMAVMTCALANGGKVLTPRLVSRIEPIEALSPEAVTIFPSHQVRDNLGVSERSLKIVRDAMLAETEDPEGTGKHVLGTTFRICGKTGTAERMERGETRNTTWFASFAPYEQPRFAVVVMVEDGEHGGGGTCAPLAREVYLALQNFDKPATANALTSLTR